MPFHPSRRAIAASASAVLAAASTLVFPFVARATDFTAIERVSVSSDGQPMNGHSVSPAVSSDGSVVAFLSDADNIVDPTRVVTPPPPPLPPTSGATPAPSTTSTTLPPSSGAVPASSTTSTTSPQPPAPRVDENGDRDAFVVENGVAELASIGSDGKAMAAYEVSTSDDGRQIAYSSGTTDAAFGDRPDIQDVFVRDRPNGDTWVPSAAPVVGLEQGIQSAYGGKISGDGDAVAFIGDVLIDEYTLVAQVLLHRRSTGQTVVVSRAPDGALGDSHSQFPSLSDDGCVVAFETTATNLGGPANSVFYRNVCTDSALRNLTPPPRDGGIFDLTETYQYAPAVSGNGRRIATTEYSSTTYYQNTVSVYDLTPYGHELRWATTDPAVSDSQAVLSDDGRRVTVNRASWAEGIDSGVVSINIASGEAARMFDEAAPFAGSGDGLTVVVESHLDLLGDVEDPFADIFRRSMILPPPVVDAAEQLVGEGGTVATNTEVSAADPVGAGVTVPGTGTTVDVMIAESTNDPAAAPSGFQLLDFQLQIEVNETVYEGDQLVTRPYSSMDQPLRLAFYLDASVLDGAQPQDLVLQRDGDVLRPCGETANVPPCVLSSSWVDGEGSAVKLEVLTDHASIWTVAAIDRTAITTDDLVQYVETWTTKRGVAISLTTKLRKGQTGAFLNELAAQSGKSIPVDKASVLRSLVGG